jgi:hypothetical protein
MSNDDSEESRPHTCQTIIHTRVDFAIGYFSDAQLSAPTLSYFKLNQFIQREFKFL